MYESSKCLHGRPRRFHGTYYSSLFLHYAPIDWNKEGRLDNHFRVPPLWYEKSIRDDPERLQVVKTSLKEPQCPHEWCGLENAITVSGPVDYGKVLLPNGGVESLHEFSETELLHASDPNAEL
mmetsp:Transcript_12344/g.20908  ORF Transcript_12344/g.20908 Transcript_12344/m.20908 type:complete len:123 (+) Transcript_12344:58-426(+)